MLRFTRLHDAEILGRLQQICALESVSYDMSGLESIIFTAEGDMRNALNALQSTVSGFGIVTSENVFKVCDQPHPQKLKAAIQKAREGRTSESMEIVMNLWGSGYAATDIIQTLFRVNAHLIFCILISLNSSLKWSAQYNLTLQYTTLNYIALPSSPLHFLVEPCFPIHSCSLRSVSG